MALGKVFVFMNNAQNSYATNVSAQATLRSVGSYFLGQWLDVSSNPDVENVEKFDQCVGLYFVDANGSCFFSGNVSKENLEKFNLQHEYELLNVAIAA